MAIKGESVGKYLTGCDIPIQECGVIISQPTVKDILQFGEDNFFAAINFFAQLDNMLEALNEEDNDLHLLNSFQLLLAIYAEDASMKQQLDTFFMLVFPLYEVKVTENSVDFLMTENEKTQIRGRINPFNFDVLRDTIKELFLPHSAEKENYNPKSARAQQIAEKIKKGKAKVAAQKGEQDTSLFGSYISILSVGMHIDLNILLNYTPFQLYDTFMRYNRKVAMDRYFDISTIPFADTSNLEAPDEWTANLYT